MIGLFDPAVDTESEVLEIRAKAKELLKQGVATMSWNSEGTSVGKQFVMPVREVMRETLMFLQKVDPDTYGYRITRTRPYFT